MMTEAAAGVMNAIPLDATIEAQETAVDNQK
jgi:hypothetical protein